MRAAAILISCAVLLASGVAQGQSTLFRRPLQSCGATCALVSAYVDRDTSSGVRDWNCGSNTYDGHRGTDFAIIGGFTAQDQGRTIVAGADGTVMATHDGETDRCTTGACGGGGGFGNYVVLQHSDGKLTYYAHMRRGSILVRMGQRVRCGEALGLVGSSGNSTGPHVHFEVRVSANSTDSFEGRAACGGGATHWVSQGAYQALPAESCQSTTVMDSGVPNDSGVAGDSGGAMDTGIPRDATSGADSASDTGMLADAAVESAADVHSDGASAGDASVRDGATSEYDPNDWGGCKCRATGAGQRARPRGAMVLVVAAMALARRRRAQSGRLEQQRKPVE